MSIEYNVISNMLTSPPSYGCRPSPKTVLDLEAISAAINLSNPTIPIATAKDVLELLREVVKLNLLAGNSVNLENFISFVLSMPIRLAKPTDLLPTNRVNIHGIPSVTFKEEVKQLATYLRLGYVTKQPQIISSYDTNTDYQYFVRNGFGCAIDGANLSFDPNQSDEGIFLTSEEGNEIKQDNILLINPSKLMFVPSLDSAVQPAGQNSVEQTLTVRTRYTENGTLRSTTFGRKLRTTNGINVLGGFDSIFVTGGNSGGPAQIIDYVPGATNRIVAKIRPDGVLVFAIAPYVGDFGQEYEVLANGAYPVEGGDDPMIINVTDYAELYSTVVDYGNYIQEIVELQPI